jgi:hypothetical protein
VWNDVLHDIWQKNRYRQYLCPTSSVFDTQLSVFVFENIRIRIRIRSYPYSNSNLNKNMKTNMVSVISVCIRSDYIPTTVFCFVYYIPLARNLHNLEPLALTIWCSQRSTEVRMGWAKTQDTKLEHNTHTSHNSSSQHNPKSFLLKWSSSCYHKESNARNWSLGA